MQQHGIAEVNGTRLYYEVEGSGPPLVLIHGFSRDTRMWDDQFEPFARRHRVLRYDIRGFGKSALPTSESYSYSEDMTALLQCLGIAQAHVLGHSLGGNIACTFALAYPESTTALLLVGSGLPGFQLPQELAEQEQEQEYRQFWRSVYDTAKEAGIEAAKKVWRNSPVARPSLETPGVAARLEQMLADYSGWHWVNDNPSRPPRQGRDPDGPPADRLGEISVSALIMVGGRESPRVHAIGDYLQQHIRVARKVVLPGVGHYPMMEDPDRFNETVLSFLAGI